MKRFLFISTLLILSATTLTAQQAARLGSRQTIAPLPKELTKDGKSYMVLVDYDSKGKKCQAGLYDSFGPSGVVKSFDIPMVKLSQSYYEKASGYTERVAMRSNYSNTVDWDGTYSSKSDVEAYINRYIISISEFTTLNGDKAYRVSSLLPDYNYWNYDSYGSMYPKFYLVIDESGHLMQYYVNYWEDWENEESVIKMETNYIEPLDTENTYSSKEDIEYYFNQGATAVQVTEFTTLDGITAYYVGDYSTGTKADDSGEKESMFWNYDKYGTKYPNHFYYITAEGHLEECYPDYYMERDLTNAIWTIDPDFSSDDDYYYYGNGKENYYEPNMGPFLYMNVDDSFYPTTPVYISQNLFNADDNWEFITFDIEFEPKDTSAVRVYDDGEIRRKISLNTIFNGIKIINEAGTQSFYLPLPDEDNEWTNDVNIQCVSVLNGLIYITTEERVYKKKSNNYNNNYEEYEGIYVIDPKDASVHAITRSLSRMNLNSTVIDQGERLDIQISESGKNDNLTISSMSGQVINSSPVTEDNSISVNTGAMPKGIYNVTLRGNGNPTENQRIIIK